MENRSSTDILLGLESKVDLLSRRFGNVENLLKILLNNFNTNPNHSETKPIVQWVDKDIKVLNKDNFEDRSKTSKFSELARKHGVDVGDDFSDVNSSTFPEYDGMEEAPARAASRGQRGAKPTVKTSVSQVLYREEGQPLFLASIEVLDDSGELINQTRTNPKGRWLMTLSPGEYQVHVLKRFPQDSGKESIDTSYRINVSSSDKPVELAPLTLSEADII